MKLSKFSLGIIFGILLVLIFNYSLLLNIAKPAGPDDIDTFHVYFILQHYMDVVTTGNWSALPTLPMFYGTPNSLFFTDNHFLPALLTWPLYFITRNIILSTNILMILTAIASFISMYLLVWYFTGRMIPSLIAGTIFTFNPMVSAHIPNYLLHFSVQWIPLIFLFFEKSLKSPNSRHLFFFFIFLTLQLLGSSLTYTVFLTAILPVYALIRIMQEKPHLKSFITKGSFTGFLFFLLTAAITGFFYFQGLRNERQNRRLELTDKFYSAWTASWFFTSENNILYGGLKEKAMDAAPDFFPLWKNAEQNLFWGVTPLLLFLLSFILLKKSSYRKLWLAALFSLIWSFLLAFGPNIHITNNLYLPGPYSLLHVIDPLFAFIRVSARAGTFVFFFLALIIGLATKVWLDKAVPGKAGLIGFFIILFVLIEYFNKPIQFISISTQTIDFYNYLSADQSIKMILDLPIGNRLPANLIQARPETSDARYFLWALFHKKILFNGYSGYMPPEYNERAIILSRDFPTALKLGMLKKWHVGAIVLHRDEFNIPEQYAIMKQKLIALKVPLVAETDNLALFDLTKWH